MHLLGTCSVLSQLCKFFYLDFFSGSKGLFTYGEEYKYKYSRRQTSVTREKST